LRTVSFSLSRSKRSISSALSEVRTGLGTAVGAPPK